LFDIPISVGTIHNRLQTAAAIASEVNRPRPVLGLGWTPRSQEIFQGSQPVLAGVDAASTYCYLLQGVQAPDEETWGWHLLDAMSKASTDYTASRMEDSIEGRPEGRHA